MSTKQPLSAIHNCDISPNDSQKPVAPVSSAIKSSPNDDNKKMGKSGVEDKENAPSRYECIAQLDEDAENEALKWEERTAVITRFDHEAYCTFAQDILHQLVELSVDHAEAAKEEKIALEKEKESILVEAEKKVEECREIPSSEAMMNEQVSTLPCPQEAEIEDESIGAEQGGGADVVVESKQVESIGAEQGGGADVVVESKQVESIGAEQGGGADVVVESKQVESIGAEQGGGADVVVENKQVKTNESENMVEKLEVLPLLEGDSTPDEHSEASKELVEEANVGSQPHGKDPSKLGQGDQATTVQSIPFEVEISTIQSSPKEQSVTKSTEKQDAETLEEVFHSGASETGSSSDGEPKEENKVSNLKPTGAFKHSEGERFFSVSSRFTMDEEEPMEVSFAATPIKKQSFETERPITQQLSDSDSDDYASAEQSFASSSKTDSHNVTIEDNDGNNEIGKDTIDVSEKVEETPHVANEHNMSDVVDALANLALQSAQKTPSKKRHPPTQLHLQSSPLRCHFEAEANDTTPDFERQEQMVLQWEKSQQASVKGTPRSKLTLTVSSTDLIADTETPKSSSAETVEGTERRSEMTGGNENIASSSSSNVPAHLLGELQILEKDKKIAALLQQIEAQEKEMSKMQFECEAIDASHLEMKETMKAFEKTIQEMRQQAKREQVLRDIETEDKLKALAQTQEDLSNAEQAFNDVSNKNERAKEAIAGFLKAEKEREKLIEKMHTKAEKAEDRYERLKAHAEMKVDGVNELLQKTKEKGEFKLAQLNARVRKADLELSSLETTLKEKNEEKLGLTKLYDELVAKRASAMFEQPKRF